MDFDALDATLSFMAPPMTSAHGGSIRKTNRSHEDSEKD
jgi:hypothetical protein